MKLEIGHLKPEQQEYLRQLVDSADGRETLSALVSGANDGAAIRLLIVALARVRSLDGCNDRTAREAEILDAFAELAHIAGVCDITNKRIDAEMLAGLEDGETPSPRAALRGIAQFMTDAGRMLLPSDRAAGFANEAWAQAVGDEASIAAASSTWNKELEAGQREPKEYSEQDRHIAVCLAIFHAKRLGYPWHEVFEVMTRKSGVTRDRWRKETDPDDVDVFRRAGEWRRANPNALIEAAPKDIRSALVVAKKYSRCAPSLQIGEDIDSPKKPTLVAGITSPQFEKFIQTAVALQEGFGPLE